jgi:ParB family chromosome partitioning protein
VHKKRGLPASIEMRHEPHYIEELLLRRGGAVGKMIKTELLVPNPYQPRKDYGNLEELSKSIKEKGVIEPIIVRPLKEKYQIICGERRYRASVMAGLTEIPCVEKEIDDKEMLEIALIENLHRKDLDAFEEAEALKKLAEEFTYTHSQIGETIGKSRSYITELLSINHIPPDVQSFCRQADIKSASILIEIARAGTHEQMWDLAKRIATRELKRDQIREAKKAHGPQDRSKSFKYTDPEGDFLCTMKFSKSEADKNRLVGALRKIIEYIHKTM